MADDIGLGEIDGQVRVSGRRGTRAAEDTNLDPAPPGSAQRVTSLNGEGHVALGSYCSRSST